MRPPLAAKAAPHWAPTVVAQTSATKQAPAIARPRRALAHVQQVRLVAPTAAPTPPPILRTAGSAVRLAPRNQTTAKLAVTVAELAAAAPVRCVTSSTSAQAVAAAKTFQNHTRAGAATSVAAPFSLALCHEPSALAASSRHPSRTGVLLPHRLALKRLWPLAQPYDVPEREQQKQLRERAERRKGKN